MNYRVTILLISCMLLLGHSGWAQQSDEKEYVYEDSVAVDTVMATPMLDEEESDTDYESTVEAPAVMEDEVDTALIANRNKINAEDRDKLFQRKDLSDARQLDSLLKAFEASNKTRELDQGTRLKGNESIDSFAEIFFWIAGLSILGFILYRLFLTSSKWRGMGVRRKPDAVTAQAEEESIDMNTLDKQINQAVANKNYRLAVRLLYLQCIGKMEDKKIIQYAPDKTNSQYVRELSGKPLQRDFAQITLQFEYVWYGQFAIDDLAFQQIREKFKQFSSRLS